MFPILPIYQLFNLATDCTEIDNALLVVVEADGQKVGLMVDDLLAQQQVVIKSLKENYQQVTGISGATILGGRFCCDDPRYTRHDYYGFKTSSTSPAR